ncbi:MAG: M56 family metallopeptidase [Planctomycetes bacterium]|nr:M56 family metallopeptidase [Planctomycetota bacterium]
MAVRIRTLPTPVSLYGASQQMAGKQDNRTFKAFALMILMAAAFIAFIGIGATVGIKGLISTTTSLFYAAFCHCASLTVCAGTDAANFWSNLAHRLQVPEAIFFWTGLGVFSTGILKAIIKSLRLLLGDRRFIRSIAEVPIDNYPRHKATLSVLNLSKIFVLFRDDNLKYSFTLGMWKPKLYMSTGTYSYLTDEEFLSTILHEDYHRRHKDPLRLFVVNVARELLYFLPISNYLSRVFLDAKEKAADDNAVYASGQPLELASAIVKLAKSAPRLSHVVPKADSPWRTYLANSMSGMDTVEERVRRLVGKELENNDKKPSRKTLFLSVALCAFFFGAIFVNGIALFTHSGKITHCMSHSCSMKCSSSQREINHALH